MLNHKLAIAVSGKHAEEVKGVCFTTICANFYVLETLFEIQTFTWYFSLFFLSITSSFLILCLLNLFLKTNFYLRYIC